MGYHWRDDPAANESSDRATRAFELRKKLENIPLSEFTVGDFAALYRIVQPRSSLDFEEEDLVRIEQKIQKATNKP
jgi:hypothetical protein